AAATSSGSTGSIADVAAVFLLSGFIFYGLMFLRYRNINKRHQHESETEATTADMRSEDRRVDSVTGSTSSRMSGANNRQVRGAQQKIAGFLPSPPRWMGRFLP